MQEIPTVNPEEILPKLVDFIKQQTEASGRSRLVVGLSGGLDSTTSAYLGARAVGSENLVAYIMPYSTSNTESFEDALLVVNQLGIFRQTIEITPMVDAYLEIHPTPDRKRRGNLMARMRMTVLYDQSEANDSLVLGTGNRTEALLGYTTLWGDMACAFTPLGGLYKTQVRQLAACLDVPRKIIAKPPSADLWEGQTDEGELDFTYEDVDRLFYQMLDLGYEDEDLEKEGFYSEFIARVRRIMLSSAFKRRMPPYPEV